MELRVSEYQRPQSITANFEELKQAITEKTALYETVVYSEDQLKAAKSDRANLNKLKTALNNERIRLEKDYMQPFDAFKAQINEIIRIIDKPIQAIDKQVKAFEQQQRDAKLTAIADYFMSCDPPADIQFLTFMDEKWLNASVSMKVIEKAITEKVDKVRQELEILRNLPHHAFEAEVVYISTLDFSKAVCEANRLQEMDEKKEAHDARMQELAQAAQQAAKREGIEATDVVEKAYDAYFEQVRKNEAAPEPEREWIAFQALLTVDEAKALGDYFKNNGIQYKAV